MRTKLHDFIQSNKVDYAERISIIKVDFDDRKMELIVRRFFLMWLLENTDPDKVKVESIDILLRDANLSHFAGQGYKMAKDKARVYMGDFVHQEMVNLNVFPPQCDQERAKHYKNYLSKVHMRFYIMKELGEETAAFRGDAGFLPYFEKSFELGYVNGKMLATAVALFIYNADRKYLHELLYPKGTYFPDMVMAPESNELKYLINPPLLLGFEEKKKQYKKVLGTWILAKLDERMLKYRLNNNNLPGAYILVKQTGEALFYNQKTTIEIERSLPEKPAATNFNPRIFKDAQAFELFEKLNTSEINATDLSFLFRKMAEKENPPMILVRDKEFRDWYAEIYNPVLVQNFTKTFARAYSKERYGAYESAKLHIF